MILYSAIKWATINSPYAQHTFQPGNVENIDGYFSFESSNIIMFIEVET
jgi:hypothetical protein